MYKTKIDLSEKTRRNVIVILNDRLSDAIDLQSQIKQAHWNVKGPHFIALHQLFDQLHGNIEQHVDSIAERITALGGRANGTLHAAAGASSLLPYPLNISDGVEHLEALSERLAGLGVAGPDIGRLQREGSLVTGGRLVTLEEVSEPRRGQRFAFVMDTRLCDAAFALADRADMLICEATFADTEASLAREYGHLTARQAGRIAAESRARLLVLTHFSQRYDHHPRGVQLLADEAAEAFGGPIVLARDLHRIPVPPRLPASPGRPLPAGGPR